MNTVPSRSVSSCPRSIRWVIVATVLLCAAPSWAATQRQMGYLSLEQSAPTQWHTIYFKTAFAVPPVVIAGPPSSYDSAPATVRVRDVTTVSFQIQLAEWDSSVNGGQVVDGVHAVEDVSWIALEPGTHTLGTQKWVAGRQAGVTATAVTVPYGSAFLVAPVVLAQVQTAVPDNLQSPTNPRGLSARVSSGNLSGFQVRLVAQQSFTQPLDAQTINWVAMDVGTGTVDSLSYVVAKVTSVTQDWKSIDLGDGRATATFLASSQTSAATDLDPFAIRMRKTAPTSTTVQIFLEEETSINTNIGHAAETVGYLAIAKPPDEVTAGLEIMTVTVNQTSPGLWQTVAFDPPGYDIPIVVFGPVQTADGDPIAVRVRSVTTTGFQFQLDEWSYQDGIHPPEKVSFVVLEAGTHYIAGRRWMALRKSGVTHDPTAIPFIRAFDDVPVIISQVVTTNETSPVIERLSGVSATGFTVQLSEEEEDSSGHAGEIVHYIAMEAGVSRMTADHFLMQALLSGNNVTSSSRTLPFAQKIALPHVLGDLQTRHDPDPVVPRITNAWESSVAARGQEEASHDAEATHGNETFGLLAVASVLDSDEDGIPDTWETANAFNPNDPLDAALDPDNDGQSNLLEHRYGSNPRVFESVGTLTLSSDILDGFERSDSGAPIAARVQINRTGGVLPATVNFTLSGAAVMGVDYGTKTTGGTPISGSISLAYGSTAAYVVLEPIADALHEYPETARVTLAPNNTGATGGRYEPGATTIADVKLHDAEDQPEFRQIFIAHLTPAASGLGSGLGTMVLNGPKTQALVSLTFNGLSSAQTNAYIRYGGDSTVGTELRPNLGNGTLQNVEWNILPAPPYSGQQIIDALYERNDKWVYTTIGTSTPADTISGKWRAQSGSVAFVAPDAAPPITARGGDALTREVARFLTQATFGPTKAEIDALEASVTAAPHNGNRIAAFSAWIDTQLAYDQTELLAYAKAADREEWDLRGVDIAIAAYDSKNPGHYNRIRGWWTISTKANDQLRQRIAFALSEIFVTSSAETTVKAYHYGQCDYYDTLGSYADGSFRNLLEAVSKHPTMGQYLSSLKNEKEVRDPNGVLLASPDENYAREIMQLFSIGLVQRHPDGSLKLDGNTGAAMPTYTSDDINDLARVFTGWSFSQTNGTGNPIPRNTIITHTPTIAADFRANSGNRFYQSNWLEAMMNFSDFHDTGPKTVLGQSISAGLSGEADLDRALDILFNHPNVAPFISRLLIQRLVTSNPSPGYIYRVAQKFTNNGSGVRGDMKAVIKAILLDYEARTLSVADQNHFGKQKEPLIRHVQLLRALDGKSSMPLANLRPASEPGKYEYPAAQLDNFPPGTTRYRYPYTGSVLGQAPLWAPSVFNWFLPDYSPGGVISTAGLVAPEMQLTTESNVVTIINYQHPLIRYSVGQNVDELYPVEPDDQTSAVLLDDVKLNLGPLTAIYNTTAGTTTAKVTAALDYLDLVLCAGDLKVRYPVVTGPVDNPREFILDAIVGMAGLPGVTPEVLMRDLLYLVAISPTCIHQK